jgi:PAS domain S-box-containing protein
VPDLLQSDVHSDRYLARNKIRGALVVPLRLQNASFGALGACSAQRTDFEVDAIYVAETIAHLVATALAHYRSETLLQQNRRVTETLYDTIDAIVLVISSSGCVQTMNRACAEISGFTQESLKGRPIWTVLAPPEEVLAYRDAIARLTASGPPFALEASLLTKHSERRIIAWRFVATPALENKTQSFLLTGIDITMQRRAEERAERAKKALAHLRTADAVMRDRDGDPFRASGRSGELASGRRLTEAERRLNARRPFPYRQNVAYLHGDTCPSEDDFVETQCRDIAAGGFSFLSPRPPASDRLVVALGSPRHLTYLTARVIHVTQVAEGDEIVHLVGCQYTGRAPS